MPETIQITLNPHSFVAFLTLAMGISYVFFNPHAPFGVMRLLAALFLVIPIALVGYQLGHGVDLAMGTAIGFATARGVSLPNPVEAIRARYYQWKFQRLQKQQRKDDRSGFEFGAEEQAKARERAEQARRERARQEQARKKRDQSESGKGNSYEKGSERSDQYSRGDTSQDAPREPVKSPLELAYEFLGIKPDMAYSDAKRRFRKMISRYHEDKAPADLTDWEVEELREKSKAVNVAWDLICKNKGWKN